MSTTGWGGSFREVGVDFESANAARMYDYFLGGAHNFAVDRERADQVIAAYPEVVQLFRANRTFLRHAVEWCLDAGIRQFLDLGSGVPTVGNVHEIAQLRDPSVRVAYVDFEPVAVAHAAEILDGHDAVTITRADVREPEAVLRQPGVADLLDFTRPIGLLAVAILPFVYQPWDAEAIMERYAAALGPGSAVAFSHVSEDQDDPDVARQLRTCFEVYRASATPPVTRSRDELYELLGVLRGFELVAPGLVDALDWPTATPNRAGAGVYVALSRRPPVWTSPARNVADGERP